MRPVCPHSGPRCGRRERPGRGGFTILELMVIVVIMGIVATTAIPVMNQSTQARQAASQDEVVRLLEFARSRALASGMPVGVVVDTSNSSLSLVTVDADDEVVSVVDQLDGQDKVSDLGMMFSGVSITSMTNGDGVGGNGTIWFDFRAEPHTRDDVTGAFDSVFTQNATITLSTDAQIVVHAGSGLVVQQ